MWRTASVDSLVTKGKGEKMRWWKGIELEERRGLLLFLMKEFWIFKYLQKVLTEKRKVEDGKGEQNYDGVTSLKSVTGRRKSSPMTWESNR